MTRCTVYRVESPTGKRYGPYVTDTGSGWNSSALADAHSDCEHPTPLGDGIVRAIYLIDENSVCGMDSLAGLRRWFAGWGEELTEHGFVVTAYRLPDRRVQRGKSGQVMFNRLGLSPAWSKTPLEAGIR